MFGVGETSQLTCQPEVWHCDDGVQAGKLPWSSVTTKCLQTLNCHPLKVVVGMSR